MQRPGVWQNVADSGNLVELGPTGGASEGRSGHDKAEGGQSLQDLECQAGKIDLSWEWWEHGRVWTGKGHNHSCVLERLLAIVRRERRGGRDQWQGWASSPASGGHSSGDGRGMINEELTRRRISGLFGVKNLQDSGRLDVNVRETEQVSWFGFP